VAQKLLQKGYQKVFALEGGWNEWFASAYPLEKRDPLPEEQKEEESEAPSETKEEAPSEKEEHVEQSESDKE